MTRKAVVGREYFLIPAAALVVGLIAIVFSQISGQTSNVVLFSGQEAMSDIVNQAATLSVGTLVLLVVCKALPGLCRWGSHAAGRRSLPSFSGLSVAFSRLTCPALPKHRRSESSSGAAVVSVLRLPLSATILALLVTQAGAGVAPLIIVGVVVAHIGTLAISARPRSEVLE